MGSVTPDPTLAAEDLFWETYLAHAAKEDKQLPDDWEADTGSILTFTGLFAATVAAFIIESYKSLAPDPGEQTVTLLLQLLAVTTNSTSNEASHVPFLQPYETPTNAIIVNSLWFSSLLIALVCSLLATLIQQWARDYRRDIGRPGTTDSLKPPQSIARGFRMIFNESALRNRAINHIYIRMGINRYSMDSVAYLIISLIHFSVGLFTIGLIAFLYPLDHIVAGIATVVLACLFMLYLLGSALPILDPSCPYRTPLTYPLALLYFLCFRLLLVLSQRWKSFPRGLGALMSRVRKRTLRDFTTRQYSGPPDFFIMEPRSFEHVMENITSQIDGIVMFRGLAAVIYRSGSEDSDLKDIMQNALAEFSLLCVNHHLLKRINAFLQTQRNDRLDASIFALVALLSERMFSGLPIGSTPESWGDARRKCVETYLEILHRISGIVHQQRLNQADSKLQLLVTLCLYRVRLQLIKLYRGAYIDGHPRLPEIDVPRTFIGYGIDADDAFRRQRRFNSDAEFFHPGGLLMLMDFQAAYLGGPGILVDNVRCGPNDVRWWYGGGAPRIKLHDSECCTSMHTLLDSGNWGHEAACAIFSVVYQALSDRDVMMELQHEVPSLLPHFFSLSLLTGDLQRRPPSKEFRLFLERNKLHTLIRRKEQIRRSRDRRPPEEVLRWAENSRLGAWCLYMARFLAENCVDWEVEDPPLPDFLSRSDPIMQNSAQHNLPDPTFPPPQSSFAPTPMAISLA
ncbi:unnamed protein product [Peniophora sp. CBMAI 1063]|nr:unnamed protein product [Peniophora sp. CBMAI 1063]